MSGTQLLWFGLALAASSIVAIVALRPPFLQRWIGGKTAAHGKYWPAPACCSLFGLSIAFYADLTSIAPGDIQLHYQNLNLFQAPYNLFLGNGSDSDVRDIGYEIRDRQTGRTVAKGVFDGLSKGQVRYLPVGFSGGQPPRQLELCLVHDGPWPFHRTASTLPLDLPAPTARHYEASGMVRTTNVFFGALDCDRAFTSR